MNKRTSKEPLKNDGMQGNEELTTELYEIVQRGGSDEVDAALRVFQRFPKAKIGVIGLAVMGANLARNIARHGFKTVVFNRTSEKTKQFLNNFGNKNLSGENTLKKFVTALEKPRKIILMVKAGEAIDELIAQLKPLLSCDDIIIDGGNSHYRDTERRQNELAKRGIHLIGMGISGGEEGALHGPSLMPGGEQKAYLQLSKILEAIAAKDSSSGKCVTYIGPGASGHFVKMVHNGIEYGLMQLIAESYDALKNIGKLSNAQLAQTFSNFNKTKNLNSFLIQITAKIFQKKEGGKYLIDLIKDVAGQKGTGKWTTEAALNYGVAIPTINAAVDARIISSGKQFRMQESKRWKLARIKSPKDPNFIKNVATALELSILNTYAQGFQLLTAASQIENWNLNVSEICRIWSGGCIIRSEMLSLYKKIFSGDKKATKIVHERFNAKNQKNWRKIISFGAQQAIPLPTMSASLNYFDAYRREKLPQNLIQAQRDFFGAHSYERIDRPGSFHTDWK